VRSGTGGSFVSCGRRDELPGLIHGSEYRHTLLGCCDLITRLKKRAGHITQGKPRLHIGEAMGKMMAHEHHRHVATPASQFIFGQGLDAPIKSLLDGACLQQPS